MREKYSKKKCKEENNTARKNTEIMIDVLITFKAPSLRSVLKMRSAALQTILVGRTQSLESNRPICRLGEHRKIEKDSSSADTIPGSVTSFRCTLADISQC